MKAVRVFLLAALAALAVTPVAMAEDPIPGCYPCDAR